MRVKLHREGINILIVGFILLLVINLPLWLWVSPLSWAIACTTVTGVIYLLAVNFFRSPKRQYKGERRDMVLSSADGKVVALEEVYEGEYLRDKAIQLSVFMSPMNVHANWFPVDGEVIYTAHHKGRFMGAYLPKSSIENERSTIVIKTPRGQLVLVRQVAGAMARRIVTYAYPGVEASIEDHMGFIKFGSRIDIYLPVDSEILVNIGDKTIGGITRLARLSGKSNS